MGQTQTSRLSTLMLTILQGESFLLLLKTFYSSANTLPLMLIEALLGDLMPLFLPVRINCLTLPLKMKVYQQVELHYKVTV